MNGDLKKTFVNEPIFVHAQKKREQGQTEKKGTEAEKESLIKSSVSFEDLILNLYKIGSLTGSQGKVHPAEDLVKKIEFVRLANFDPKTLTRSGGLRDKVIELLNLKK